MKKNILMILCTFILVVLVLTNTTTAFANEIVVSDIDRGERSIVSSSQNVEIPIWVVGYSDVYAVDIEFLFNTEQIEFVEIKKGNLFNGLSSEILINEMNNQEGTARFTQTLVDTSSGVTADAVLCILSLKFEYGNYDISDLGITVQIANSTPEYLTTNLTSLSIIVDQDAEPTPIPSATPTPSAMPTPTVSQSPETSATATPDLAVTPTPKTSEDENDLPSTATSDYLWLVISVLVFVIAGAFLIINYKKIKLTD